MADPLRAADRPYVSHLDMEVVADLRGLRAEFAAFRGLMDERDRRYEERDQAAKAAVRAALEATEKAADSLASGLREFKSSANEWRDTVKDLVARMPTRVEVEQQFKAVDNKIAVLRESQSSVQGADLQRGTERQQHNVNRASLTAVVVAAVGWVVAIVVAVAMYVKP